MIGGVLGVVLIHDNERDGYEAEWLASHTTSGLTAHSGLGVPDALRKMADAIDKAEEHRAGLPD